MLGILPKDACRFFFVCAMFFQNAVYSCSVTTMGFVKGCIRAHYMGYVENAQLSLIRIEIFEVNHK